MKGFTGDGAFELGLQGWIGVCQGDEQEGYSRQMESFGESRRKEKRELITCLSLAAGGMCARRINSEAEGPGRL